MFTFLFIACSSGDQTFGAVNETIGQAQGLAKMEYSPDVLIFTDVQAGFTHGKNITITSVGDGALKIDRVQLSNNDEGAFSISEGDAENLSLLPEVSVDFTVNVMISDSEPRVGELRIRTNDEENRDVRVKLCAYPIDYPGETTCAEEPSDTGNGDTGRK